MVRAPIIGTTYDGLEVQRTQATIDWRVEARKYSAALEMARADLAAAAARIEQLELQLYGKRGSGQGG
jgi:hypothetical protein